MVHFKMWKNSDQVLGLIHFMCSSLLILPSGPEGQLSRALLLVSIIQSCSVVCLKHGPWVVSLKNGDYCCDQRTLLEITCVVRIITGITTCQHLFSVFPKYRATARKTAQNQTNNPRFRATLASLKVPWQSQRWQNHLLKLCVWLNVATRALLPPPSVPPPPPPSYQDPTPEHQQRWWWWWSTCLYARDPPSNALLQNQPEQPSDFAKSETYWWVKEGNWTEMED